MLPAASSCKSPDRRIDGLDIKVVPSNDDNNSITIQIVQLNSI